MTDHIQELLQFFIQDRKHRALRKPEADKYRYAKIYKEKGLSDLSRSVCRLKEMLTEERPVVFPFEKIAFLRTVPTIPEIFTKEEFAIISAKNYIHEQGKVCNISPEYSLLLNTGLEKKRALVSSAYDHF